MNESIKICTAILAAGASSRLGRPKQLVKIGKQSLLERAINAAEGATSGQIVTILGAHRDEILQQVQFGRSAVVFNSDWAQGLSSSIRQAIAYVESRDEAIDAVLFMVADQPHVCCEVLDQLVQKFARAKAQVVCCQYGETLGVPALFARTLFGELKQLSGDTGARKVILNHQSELQFVRFEAGICDIDTEEDLFSLCESDDGKAADKH